MPIVCIIVISTNDFLSYDCPCAGESVSLFPAIREYSSVLITSSLCTSGSVTPCNHMTLSTAGVFCLLSLFAPLLFDLHEELFSSVFLSPALCS